MNSGQTADFDLISVHPVENSGATGMGDMQISGGVVHDLPDDLRHALTADAAVLERWEDITPLARNEWICWVQSVKKAETRERHIRQLGENLKAGKRRPCCWPGCPHRERTGRA